MMTVLGLVARGDGKTYPKCGVASGIFCGQHHGPGRRTKAEMIICGNSKNASDNKIFEPARCELVTGLERIGHFDLDGNKRC